MKTMTATDLHEHLRHFAADYWERRSEVRSADAEKQLTAVLNGLVEKGVIRSWTGLKAVVPSAYCETQEVSIHVEVRSTDTPVEQWELDVHWPPPGHKERALLVVDLAKELNEFVSQGRGDYYVVHPGVAGDVYCTYVYLDEEDEWTVCVIADDDEKVLSKRERFAEAGLKLPTLVEWREMQRDLKARTEELERNDAFFRRLSAKLDTETIDIETLEAAFNTEMATAERVCQKLKDSILVRPQCVRSWESFHAKGGNEVEVTLRVSQKTFQYGMLPGLKDNRGVKVEEVPPMNEPPVRRDYTAMEDAVVLLRAKLLEHEPAALVDSVLMAGLRSAVGDDWYQHLVDRTEDVLSKSVKLPPRNNIASDDYVHLRPTGTGDFGRTVKTILFCGAAITEHNPPPTTYNIKKVTCPHCIVAYERKWQAYMEGKQR